QLALQNDAAADTGADREIYQVRLAMVPAQVVFADRRRVGVVLEKHRQAQLPLEPVERRAIGALFGHPDQRRHVDGAALDIDDAGNADADAPDTIRGDAGGAQPVADGGGQLFRHQLVETRLDRDLLKTLDIAQQVD